MTDNNDTTAPEMIDGAHIGGADEQTNEHQSGLSSPTSTTTITGQTAGVDEPAPSVRDAEELDDWGGEPPKESEASEESAPETQYSDTVDWILPDETDEDGGRTGVLSTRTEVHAVALGITAGSHFGLSGDAQLINDVVGVGILGDRVRRANAFPERYLEQAQEELPHFLGGVLVGYVATRVEHGTLLAEMGVG